MANSTLVIIPTYNEAENLPLIVGRVVQADPEVDVLVVDDNSPDGTGELADELAGSHPEVHVLHRTGKEGLLAAYRAGFAWGLERDYAVLCQMDADGSHAPEELSLLIDAIDDGADIAIGSRYVEGGETRNWPWHRRLLSELGNRYIALALGDDVKDMTAGYRAFRREVLETIDLDELSSKGYIFQVDLAHKAIEAGFDVREVPITFEDRRFGESKLDASFAVTSLAEVTKWGVSEKASAAGELAKEVSSLSAYELKHAGLDRVGSSVVAAAKNAAAAAGEMAGLARYELGRSGAKKLPQRAKGVVVDAAEAAKSTAQLAQYEARHAGLIK